MLDFIELFILGIGVGSFGALVGIGGGLIMVPLFMYFMMPPSGSTFANVQEVVGTSLFGVLLNALSGTWAYFRQKRIILSVAMPFALATVPGAFLGSYVSEWFSGPAFSITFGASLAFLGCFMYWSSRNKAANRSADEFDPNELPRSKIWLGIGCSFFVGFISSILGIGGGVVHVPMMVFLLGFPPLVAVATSTFVLMVSAAIGVVGHALLAHIVWAPAVAVGCGAIVGAQLGARLARKSKPRLIVILLSCVMVALGCQLVWRGLSLCSGTDEPPSRMSFPRPAPRRARRFKAATFSPFADLPDASCENGLHQDRSSATLSRPNCSGMAEAVSGPPAPT